MPFLGTTPTQGFVGANPKQSFTANGSTTVFTLTNPVASANDLEVFVGNVRQEPTAAYTAAGTTLTMSEAPDTGLNFYVINKSQAQVTTTPPVNSISTDKIVSNAVSTAKIADDAVTGDKLSNDVAIANALSINTTARDASLEVNSSSSKINTLTVKTAAGSGGVAGIGFMAGQTTAGREKAAIFFKETNGGAHYTGDIVFAVASSSGNAAQVAASDEVCRITPNGLAIGGTGTANTLDDYEEGTWTPFCGTPGVSGSYSVQMGRYIKVGNLVQCIFNLTTSGSYTGSTSSVFQLGGLPFASKFYHASLYGGGNIGYYFNINTNDAVKQIVYQIPSGSGSAFELKGTADNSGEISIIVSNMNSNSVIRGQLVYHTA